jgi:hypothetical protein
MVRQSRGQWNRQIDVSCQVLQRPDESTLGIGDVAFWISSGAIELTDCGCPVQITELFSARPGATIAEKLRILREVSWSIAAPIKPAPYISLAELLKASI